ncbi:MAG: DegV family protein [Coriobacteriia bacterium]
MNATKGLPTTSQPSVGAFLETFESALARCKDVVSINISNRLSGTIESAREAAWLEDAIRSRFNVAELAVIETGSVIGTHTGTGWGLTGAELG